LIAGKISGAIIAAVLLIFSAAPIVAADSNIDVQFDVVRETPVEVTVRATISGDIANTPVDVILEDLDGSPIDSSAAVEIKEVSQTTYVKDVPVYEMRDSQVKDLVTIVEDVDLADYLKRLDETTTLKSLSTSLSLESKLSYTEKDKLSGLIDDYPAQVHDVARYDHVITPKEDALSIARFARQETEKQFDFGCRGTRVLDITINTGAIAAGNGWGTSGVLKLRIDGKDYYDLSNSSWWNANWSYRNILSFKAGDIDEDLTDFSVLVHLTSERFDFDKIKANGADIRFTDSDGTTPLNYEIDTWSDVDEEAYVWVKVPQIDANSSYTDYIFIYYGNESASDDQDAEHVWGDWDVITNCEVTDDWSASVGGSVTADGTAPKEGTYNIRNTVAAPEAGTEYTATYNPSGTWDMSNAGENLDFWFKSDRSSGSYTHARVYIYDSDSNYRYWDMGFNVDAWKNICEQVDSGDGESATSPDLTDIDSIVVNVKAADTTTFNYEVDWIEGRWGYVAVYHMNDDGAGTGILDSTRYCNDGTKGAGAAAPTEVDGIIGKAQSFVDGYIDCGDGESLHNISQNLTVEYLINPADETRPV